LLSGGQTTLVKRAATDLAMVLNLPADSPSTPESTSRRSQFVFARHAGERAAEINTFYNGFTGRSRSLDAYRWEFQAGPGGPALVWTITDVSTGRLVGHHAIIPTPLVKRGTRTAGGRTENTIIDPAVRHKVFYPGMEKKALTEALQSLRIVYTIHSSGPGRLRARLGYKPVGRWVVYLPKLGPAYLGALLRRGRSALAIKVPDAVLMLAATLVGRLHALGGLFRGRPKSLQVAEITDIAEVADEYAQFWNRARSGYDLTLDRSLEFLRWRVYDNPHLTFRTWTVRRDRELAAIVIGHRHSLGTASALYIDDMIVGDYQDDNFDAVLSYLPHLDPTAGAIIVMTLAADTPLHRVLLRRFPLQSFLLKRFGPRLFDEMLALNNDGAGADEPWYVTPLFTEGLDTSR
jgi:hypothetical protein